MGLFWLLFPKRKTQIESFLVLNTNENIVTSSGGAAPFNVGGFTVIGSWVEEGQSLGYLRVTDSTPYGDGTFTRETNSILGKTFAPEFGSFNLYYRWNKLNFFASGDYQLGGKIVDLSAGPLRS